jgi:hypothetical protein
MSALHHNATPLYAYLILDTETTGLPKRWDAPHTGCDNRHE